MIKCNTCAKSIPEDSEFCPFCGDKMIHVDEKSPVSTDTLYSSDPQILITKAFLFLEESQFDKADTYVELVLNREPENAKAYLAKLLLDYNAKTLDDLSTLEEPFDDNINYKRVIRYGDEELKQKVSEIHNKLIVKIEKQNEEEAIRQEIFCIETYKKAKQLMSDSEEMENAEAVNALKEAAELFSQITEYKDAADLQAECEKAHSYKLACSMLESGSDDELKRANYLFEKIIDYKDSKEKIKECANLIEFNKKLERRLAYSFVGIIAGIILAAAIIMSLS